MTNEEANNRGTIINPKIDALWNSGFLLERRVASLLHKLGYKAITNRGFYDNESNKSLEYDVYAYKSFNIFDKSESTEIFPTLIVECKNNKEPIAFFNQDEREFEPLIDEVRFSGIPSKIWKKTNIFLYKNLLKLIIFITIVNRKHQLPRCVASLLKSEIQDRQEMIPKQNNLKPITI